MVLAPGHVEPAAQRDGAIGRNVGVERAGGPHAQIIAAYRVDDDGKGRPVGERDHGRDVVAGSGHLGRVEGQLAGQHGVERGALIHKFNDAFALHRRRRAARRLHRQVRALSHRHAGIHLDERHRAREAGVRIEHQAAVEQLVVGAGAAHGQEIVGRGAHVERVAHKVLREQVPVNYGLVRGRIQHREVVEGNAPVIEREGLVGQAEGRTQLRHHKAGIGRGIECAAHHGRGGCPRHGQLAAHVAAGAPHLTHRKWLDQRQVEAGGIHGEVEWGGAAGEVGAAHPHIVAVSAQRTGRPAGQAAVHVVAVGTGVGGFEGDVTDEGFLKHQVFHRGIGRKGLVGLAQVVDAGYAVE